jgi:hypothetical protein
VLDGGCEALNPPARATVERRIWIERRPISPAVMILPTRSPRSSCATPRRFVLFPIC